MCSRGVHCMATPPKTKWKYVYILLSDSNSNLIKLLFAFFRFFSAALCCDSSVLSVHRTHRVHTIPSITCQFSNYIYFVGTIC